MGCFQTFLVFSLFKLTAGTARSSTGEGERLHSTPPWLGEELLEEAALDASLLFATELMVTEVEELLDDPSESVPVRDSAEALRGHECFSMFKYRKYSWVKIPLRVVESWIDCQDLLFSWLRVSTYLVRYMFYGSVATPAIALSPPQQQDWKTFKKSVTKKFKATQAAWARKLSLGRDFGLQHSSKRRQFWAGADTGSFVASESVLPSDSNVGRLPLSLKSLCSDAELGSNLCLEDSEGLGKSFRLKLICYWSLIVWFRITAAWRLTASTSRWTTTCTTARSIWRWTIAYTTVRSPWRGTLGICCGHGSLGTLDQKNILYIDESCTDFLKTARIKISSKFQGI